MVRHPGAISALHAWLVGDLPWVHHCWEIMWTLDKVVSFFPFHVHWCWVFNCTQLLTPSWGRVTHHLHRSTGDCCHRWGCPAWMRNQSSSPGGFTDEAVLPGWATSRLLQVGLLTRLSCLDEEPVVFSRWVYWRGCPAWMRNQSSSPGGFTDEAVLPGWGTSRLLQVGLLTRLSCLDEQPVVFSRWVYWRGCPAWMRNQSSSPGGFNDEAVLPGWATSRLLQVGLLTRLSCLDEEPVVFSRWVYWRGCPAWMRNQSSSPGGFTDEAALPGWGTSRLLQVGLLTRLSCLDEEPVVFSRWVYWRGCPAWMRNQSSSPGGFTDEAVLPGWGTSRLLQVGLLTRLSCLDEQPVVFSRWVYRYRVANFYGRLQGHGYPWE